MDKAKFPVNLSREAAETLLWLQRRGVLDESLLSLNADFTISDSKIIGDAAAAAVIEAKLRENEFDVFLCHHSCDKSDVKKIGVKLRNYGIRPWLDEWELRPGLPWQSTLQDQIEKIKSVAVFVGNNGMGPWQSMELNALISEFVERGCPVIPVMLRKCKKKPDIPPFLKGMTWVDLKKRKPDPIDKLIWGITGIRI